MYTLEDSLMDERLTYPIRKVPTLSAKSYSTLKSQDFLKTPDKLLEIFPLPWSAYVSLISVKDGDARKFYEEEALRGGWSVRQLNRQISTLFFEFKRNIMFLTVIILIL